jgi:hypothetical protein
MCLRAGGVAVVPAVGKNGGSAVEGDGEGCREGHDVDHHGNVGVQRGGVGAVEGSVETDQVAGLLMGREHVPSLPSGDLPTRERHR